MIHMPVFRFGIALAALVLLVPLAFVYAERHLEISHVRAVRLSDSSISLSFMTSHIATATVMYTGAAGQAITLSDTNAQIDHLFTVNELEADDAYSFSITAGKNEVVSNKYLVLLSPEMVGVPGQSMMPAVQEIDAEGATVASTPAASSTPDTGISISPWLFVVLAGGVLLSWGVSKRRQQPVE